MKNPFSLLGALTARVSVRIMVCVVLFAGVFTSPAQAALPNGISGAWFNPAQGGHGLSIEMLGDGRAIAYWFVYDRDGAPIHLYLDGIVQHRFITGTAYHHEGMRFGEFDPATLRQSVWGFIALQFTDCNHGVLTYNAEGPAGAGYGTGTIAIQRLSRLAETTCDFGVADTLPTGLYDVDVESSTPGSFPKRLVAAVDPDGRLWATSPSPSSTRYLGTRPNKPIIIGAAEASVQSWVPLQLRVFDDSAFGRDPPMPAFSLRGEAYVPAGLESVSADIASPTPNVLTNRISIGFRATGNTALQSGLRISDLTPNVYVVTFDAQFAADVALLRFRSDGSFCLSAFNSDDPSSCAWNGQIRVPDSGWKFFDFTITRTIGTATRHYAGRGWVEGAGSDANRIVFVGADATEGAGFVAELRPPQ